ncbi:hypothetical protein SY2F82_52720 [Streptomyces sp. Y2F8-2]|nr:hypothetical protein SY2F82_52720 [Streptomyces sp. Y2F8-2]
MYAPACPWRTDELTKRATDGLTTLANRRQVRCARDEPPTTDRRKAGGKRTAPYAGERTPHGWARAPVAEDPRAADPARLVPLVRDGTLPPAAAVWPTTRRSSRSGPARPSPAERSPDSVAPLQAQRLRC